MSGRWLNKRCPRCGGHSLRSWLHHLGRRCRCLSSESSGLLPLFRVRRILGAQEAGKCASRSPSADQAAGVGIAVTHPTLQIFTADPVCRPQLRSLQIPSGRYICVLTSIETGTPFQMVEVVFCLVEQLIFHVAP